MSDLSRWYEQIARDEDRAVAEQIKRDEASPDTFEPIGVIVARILGGIKTGKDGDK